MLITLVRSAARVAGVVVHAALAGVRAVASRLCAAWEAHRRLLTTNRSYGAALAAGATAIVRQLEPIDVVAAIVATAFAIVAAVRQSNTVDQADRWLDFDDPDSSWPTAGRRP